MEWELGFVHKMKKIVKKYKQTNKQINNDLPFTSSSLKIHCSDKTALLSQTFLHGEKTSENKWRVTL